MTIPAADPAADPAAIPAADPAARRPVLVMTGITKQFPGVLALSGVDFRLFPGEIHALLGQNGAGKSTLIKVLTGVYGINGGEIDLDGRPVRFTGPLQAQQSGVSTVYQEINLCPNLSVAENILIGRAPRRLGRIDWRQVNERARALLARLQLDLDVTQPLADCSIAVQQMVAIARALDVDAKVLILDEPTSSLDAGEVEQLFAVMRRLRDEGIAICFVTHFLDQVYAVSDRITVLRNGALVGEYTPDELPQLALVEKMVGKAMGTLEQLDRAPKRQLADSAGPPLVAARGLGRRNAVEPFDLEIAPGEVVGLAGLLGAGRTEAARLFCAADRADRGHLELNGSQVTLRTPHAAMEAGIAFCSENRRAEGLIPQLSVRENILLAMQASRGWARPIGRRKGDELVEKYIQALGVRPADPDAAVSTLSGGNQQKVLLARLITEPKLLILDEPTRGIDVGAKAEIQRLVASLSDDGMAVLFISAELEEILRLSHKIAVLRDRRMVAQLANTEDVGTDQIMETIASGACA